MSLKQMWEERAGRLRERDQKYSEQQSLFDGKDPKEKASSTSGYAPQLQDAPSGSDPDKLRINHVRRIVMYQSALYARPPTVLPYKMTDLDLQARTEAGLERIKSDSKLQQQQPRQAHWLSLRGDAVYVVDYDERDEDARIFWRSFDPAWCYPTFDDHDLGALKDLLISYQIDSQSAEKIYGVKEEKKLLRVCIYYGPDDIRLEVEGKSIDKFHRKHELGFCPARWCFASGDAQMGQSDVREIMALQALHSDSLQIAVEVLRKKADPAYYGTGIKGNVAPRAGEVIGFPNPDAKIQEFPMGVDPELVIQSMSVLEQYINAIAGVSPISATGQASGSIVTGTAVRSQVEAMEVRAESRRAAMESWYGELATMSLKMLGKVFKDKSLKTARGDLRGKEIEGQTRCYASYGSLFGLDTQTRIRVAMEGLGRLWDDRTAIDFMDLPGVVTENLVDGIKDYQKRQAEMTAEAQKAAQKIEQGNQPMPGMPPLHPTPPRPQPTLPLLQQAGRQMRQ